MLESHYHFYERELMYWRKFIDYTSLAMEYF